MLTDLNIIQTGQQWPPDSESARLKTYRDNRLLYRGQHERVFDEATARRIFREETQEAVFFLLNYPKRLSTHWADMLFSEPPVIAAGDPGSNEQTALERIMDDSDFLSMAYEAALDMSRCGDGLFKVYSREGRPRIEAVYPAHWYPVLSPTSNREVTAHVLAWEFEQAEGDRVKRYVRFEIHEPGSITHRVFQLQTKGGLTLLKKNDPVRDMVLGDELDPAQFDPDLKSEGRTLTRDGRALVEETGVDGMLVIPAHGLRASDEYHGQDDYTDLESIVSELEVRFAQIARILDKHSDPNLAGPSQATERDDETGRNTIKLGGKYFVIDDKDMPVPQYVTWDGELEAAFKQIDKLIEQFFFVAETSPAAFGILQSGLAESGSALKRLLMNDIIKRSRMEQALTPAMRYALELAAELQGVESITPEITWRDPIPVDEKEQAEAAEIRVRAGLSSRKAEIKKLHGFVTDAQAEGRLADIRAEQAEAQAAQPNPPPAGTSRPQA